MINKIKEIFKSKKQYTGKSREKFYQYQIEKDLELLKGKSVYGLKKWDKSFQWNTERKSHSLYVGSMGSGSVLAARSNIIAQLYTNPSTLFIGMDLMKGLSDFNLLNERNHIKIINKNNNAFYNMIYLIKEELNLRMKSKDNKYSEIIFFTEQAHMFFNNFKNKDDLIFILKNGINYGIQIIFSSQKGIIDNCLKEYFFKQIFKVTKNESIHLLKNEKASGLYSSKDIGICFSENNIHLYPIIHNDTLSNIIDQMNQKEIKTEINFQSFINEIDDIKKIESRLLNYLL